MMTWLELVRYCFVNIKGRKLRSLLTVLGVSIGICSVILFLSIGTGYRTNVMKRFTGDNAATLIQVTAQKTSNLQEEDLDQIVCDETLKKMEEIPSVIGVSPQLTLQGEFSYGKYKGNLVLNGVEKKRLKQIKAGTGKYPEQSAGEVQVIACCNVKNTLYYTEGIKVIQAKMKDVIGKSDSSSVWKFFEGIHSISVMNENYFTNMLDEDMTQDANNDLQENQVGEIKESTGIWRDKSLYSASVAKQTGKI